MFEQTEVDGVPTLIAPTTGPLRAGLAFRVGRADEALARAGVTHLVEHLALHGHGLTDYHFNGATAAVTTHFHMQGSEDDVVAFLGGVCASLSDLPMERLETEKSILRTEASGRGRGVNEAMPVWRHGARGYGLLSYPEWGLSEFTPEFVRAWAQRWFTRDNAVLWIAGDQVPRGLKLALPSGERMPLPAVTSALPSTPAFFRGDDDGVVLDAIVTRSSAASAYSTVLERQLFRALRQEGGLSYKAGTSYDPSGDGTATITAVADALPEKNGAVLGGFIDVLMALKVGRIDEADLAAHQAKAAEGFRHPEFVAAMLPSAAGDLLAGRPPRELETLAAEVAAVTVSDVHTVAVEAMSSALLMTPSGCSAEWAGFAEAPRFSGRAVVGRHHAGRNGKTSLVMAEQGVSIVSTDDERAVTVHFAACSALLAWPDGARRVIGDDGFVLHIEPTLFDVPPGGVAALDAAVPPDRIVHMPAREPDQIPAPPEPAAPPRDGFFTRHKNVLIAVAVVAVVGLVVAGFASGQLRSIQVFGAVLRFGCIAAVVTGIGAWRARKG